MESQDSTDDISEGTELTYAMWGVLITAGILSVPLAPLWLAYKIRDLLKNRLFYALSKPLSKHHQTQEKNFDSFTME